MNFKYYKPSPLIITILILAGLIEACVSKWIHPFLSEYLPLGSHFRVPTTVSLLGVFFILYDNWLWNIPVLKLLMAVPDMRGRYEGKIIYERDGNFSEKNCFIEITQTASKIKVHTYFSNGMNENTSSKSLIEEIKEEDDGFFDIYLFYMNSGTKRTGVLDYHEGANKLRFIPGLNGMGNKLTGHYFTNRQSQTRGEIEGTLISKTLQGKF